LVNAAYLLALCGASSHAPSASCVPLMAAQIGRAKREFVEAHALPVMESASALTSAKIDLLPHRWC
jgi:hypothetical protein